MIDVHELHWRVVALEQQIRPIARRPVPFGAAALAQELATRPDPLDEAGVREEAHMVLADLMAHYQQGSPAIRELIRGYFDSNPSFAWATGLPFPADTTEHFRAHLVLFSIRDQGRDSRDAILELQALVHSAQDAGIPVTAILHEVASMSSSVNRYGMGSTHDQLLAAINWKGAR